MADPENTQSPEGTDAIGSSGEMLGPDGKPYDRPDPSPHAERLQEIGARPRAEDRLDWIEYYLHKKFHDSKTPFITLEEAAVIVDAREAAAREREDPGTVRPRKDPDA